MFAPRGAWLSVGVRPSLYLPREPRTEPESELNSESRVFRLGCQPISRVTLPPRPTFCLSLAVSNVVFVAGAVVQTNIQTYNYIYIRIKHTYIYVSVYLPFSFQFISFIYAIFYVLIHSFPLLLFWFFVFSVLLLICCRSVSVALSDKYIYICIQVVKLIRLNLFDSFFISFRFVTFWFYYDSLTMYRTIFINQLCIIITIIMIMLNSKKQKKKNYLRIFTITTTTTTTRTTTRTRTHAVNIKRKLLLHLLYRYFYVFVCFGFISRKTK